jgi:hypothetical protein
MKAAVFNGMFAADPNPQLTFNCPTGNCTWPDFSTLGVCSSCIDMSEYMQRACSVDNSTDCGWILPNGAQLNGSASVFSMTTFISTDGDMPYSTIMQLVFMGTEAQNSSTSTSSSSQSPWSTQCTLEYCVQDLHSSVLNGQLATSVTNTHRNTSVVPITSALKNGINTPLYIVPITTTNSSSNHHNQTYQVGMGALLGMQQWFSDLFRNGSANRESASQLSKMENNIIVNLTVGVSSGETYFDTDIVQAFYWFYYQYPAGLAMLTSELATTMTNAFRASGGAVPVSGQAYELSPFVHIRWGWITLPVLVILMTGAFLGASMVRSRKTRTKLWKSSALAMLFHGLDKETRKRALGSGDLSVVKVRLNDSAYGPGEGDGARLLRTE